MYNAPRASVLWFLLVLMLSVYTWGYSWPAYIRRSNVSVPAGSGRYIGPPSSITIPPIIIPPLHFRFHRRRLPPSTFRNPPQSQSFNNPNNSRNVGQSPSSRNHKKPLWPWCRRYGPHQFLRSPHLPPPYSPPPSPPQETPSGFFRCIINSYDTNCWDQ